MHFDDDFTTLAAAGKLVCLVRFPGYAATTTGRVFSCLKRGGRKRVLGVEWRELRPRRQKGGYCYVSINGKNVGVHVLVLEAFVGPCPPGLEACHWNDVSDDNRLENLRWDNSEGNWDDRVRNHHVGCAKLIDVEVREIRRLRRSGLRQREIAEMFGIGMTTVRHIIHRRTWKRVI